MGFDNKNLINEIKQKVEETQEREIKVTLGILDEWLAYCNTPKFEENFEQMLFNSISRGCTRAILNISFTADPDFYGATFEINCDKVLCGGLGDRTLHFQHNNIEKYSSIIKEKIKQITRTCVSRLNTINGVSATYHDSVYTGPECYYNIYIDW